MSHRIAARGAEVTLEHLTKRYGSAAPAVDDVSLTIRPGEFMTLLGPSGSGKTTTLNMIAGFVEPTTGRILVDGKNVAKLPPHKRDIGMVFQHYALFPHMSAAQNVAFPLQERKVSKAEVASRVSEALELVQLGHLADRLPRQLSGGQQQRVALARALVYDPPVLLMDEPLGALDKKLREQLQVEISRIHREVGTTFVFVTHDQEEALALSDRIAVFNNGVIEQVGTAEELYEQPKTLFVAEFLGKSNVFVGTAQGETLTVGDVTLRLPRPESGSRALVVRPERMRLHPDAPQPPTAGNALHGVVSNHVYLGSEHRITVELGTGTSVTVTETAAARSDARPGDSVWITWEPQDSSVIPA
jgi:putative spermidine/putrescine transport system ATP-binding protein